MKGLPVSPRRSCIVEDGTYIRPWVDAKVAEIGAEIIEMRTI